jgi:hypothetical protein
MARNLKVGETVLVPVSRINEAYEAPHSLVKAKVLEVKDRTVELELHYGLGVHSIGTSAVHRAIGVCVIRIGDFLNETSHLDPLAKSLLQYLRLLLPDDQVKLYEVRTRAELRHLFSISHIAYTHYVLIGHASTNGELIFPLDGNIPSGDIAADLAASNPSPKTFITLCCHAGEPAFAGAFSQSPCCHALIAPDGALHGAAASLFAQSYFAFHFLEGKTTLPAFKHAKDHQAGKSGLTLWKNGQQQ